MKKLTNKKGFTLIEMLVVIAIIAVLVAIIIPVVSSATDKAAAATNAANLRAIKAEATTDLLNGASDTTGYVKFTPKSADGKTAAKLQVQDSAPLSKKCGDCGKDVKAECFIDSTGNVSVYYGNYTISDFAKVAEEGGDLAAGTTKPTA